MATERLLIIGANEDGASVLNFIDPGLGIGQREFKMSVVKDANGTNLADGDAVVLR